MTLALPAAASGTAAAAVAGKAVADAPKAATGSAEDTGAAKSGTTVKLSDEALAQLRKLQARDRDVRNHEQAHLAAAGGLATGGPTFSYEKGPDGVSYAIGGEVHIDVSPGRTPEDTIAKARIIEAAALAPADPSGPDLAVAAEARQMAQQASAELQQQQAQQQQAKLAGAYSAGTGTSHSGSRVDNYA
ncbi:putative metalloprotease CJM1_0395 family protein [Undibacterium sp. TJN25]|uniref:putative metalloprotease CJM1_0395 family protein n=1 Tax=Undibacterium sp. TJN25 TaxID=3413056 RepID=UPI003BEFC786